MGEIKLFVEDMLIIVEIQYQEKKGIQIRMGEIKLFAEDMFIIVEIPNESIKNPYENHEVNLERPQCVCVCTHTHIFSLWHLHNNGIKTYL